MKLLYQYMATFRELRQQFAACSGWDDNGKFRPERVKHQDLVRFGLKFHPLGVVGRGNEKQLQSGKKVIQLNALKFNYDIIYNYLEEVGMYNFSDNMLLQTAHKS